MAATKRLVQVYKPAGGWSGSPPGIGDFIRGTCTLFELTQQFGMELRVDVSQTDFADLIDPDPALFQRGDPDRIDSAEEYFRDHAALFGRILTFSASDQTELYVSSNVGAWDRPSLPAPVANFARPFYSFRSDIDASNREWLGNGPYSVLSVRCGDEFFGSDTKRMGVVLRLALFDAIRRIVATPQFPVVVLSDSLRMKQEIATRFGMRASPTLPQHGAAGGALSVVKDLDMLRHSSFNFHINVRRGWWSGFSHYTSLIFGIPERNVAGPLVKDYV